MKISTLTLKSSVLVSVFIFSVASMGIVQAKECDMPDEIAAGNSAAVRDDCPEQGGAQEKKRQKKQLEGIHPRRTNLGSAQTVRKVITCMTFPKTITELALSAKAVIS